MTRLRVTSATAARRWRPAEDALLAKLLEEGKDLGAIAVQLDRTIASVQQRRQEIYARSLKRQVEP